MRASILVLPILGALSSNAAVVRKRTGSWTSHGCWSDLATTVDLGPLRALNTFDSTIDSSHMTPEACQDACDSAGYMLAGVEWGHECYCGNTIIGNNRPIDDGNCYYLCSGNFGEICGGASALNLYVKDNYPFTTGPALPIDSYNGYQRTACWQDPFISARVLPDTPSAALNPQQMTVGLCVDACAAQGYTSAGLEYSRECYCGNLTYPIGESTDMYLCGEACLGDASQSCGGPNLMITYSNLFTEPLP